jgi:NhaP-type Na+/H+ or K+/H+ antiporter
MDHITPLLLLGLIGLFGFLSQWLAEQVKLPAILFLLIIGILLGPILSVLNPDALFGELLFPYISLSVAVILFEGALTLSRHELKEIGRPVLKLISVGMLINGLITAVATHYIVGFSWAMSALFGAIMVVTGPTVIMPMLKAVRPQPKIGDALRWEGIIIDPIGALFAVLVYEFIIVLQLDAGYGEIAQVFLSTIGVGIAIGVAAGYGFGLLIRNHKIPEGIQNFAALAFVCFVFSLSDELMHESGLLAVTLMGIILANMRGVNTRAILGFKEDLTVVLVSVLFIVLAARIEFSGFIALGWSAVVLFLVMQFIARPINVFVSFIGSDFSWQERALVAWIGPRGIVAAAVVAVFAIRIESLGYEDASLLVPLAFTIIIGTVFVQGLTARSIALRLGVAQPATDGVVIYGANSFSIQLAGLMNSLGIAVLLCDSNWDKLRQPRLHGINTYHGNPSSKDALKKIELDNYGVFLGLADHYEANVAQANRFKETFGERRVFILPVHNSHGNPERDLATEDFSARTLFSDDLNSFQLARVIAFGGAVKTTKLSENFDFEKWRAHAPNAAPMCVLTAAGELNFAVSGEALSTQADDQIIYLANGFKANIVGHKVEGEQEVTAASK